MKQSGASFCDLGNQAVTDSRIEAWKIRPFGTFQPMKSTENRDEVKKEYSIFGKNLNTLSEIIFS